MHKNFTKFFLFSAVLILIISAGIFIKNNFKSQSGAAVANPVAQPDKQDLNPLTIAAMRARNYPGSDLKIEQTLPDAAGYHQYIASYLSDGLKIYGLLTIPKRDPSASPQDDNRKYPVIVFNHGYIPPEQYRTTERYGAYVDGFARAGYIVFKPDYRGNGNSEGTPGGAYYAPSYTVDVLNAVASLKKYPDANPEKIGMWGHSLGGSITLRSMVVTKDIKAGVIWAGVVASYEDMMKNWRRVVPFMPSEREQAFRRPGRQALIDKHGDSDKNPQFWQSISPIFFVKDISGPLQLHHGTGDNEVPILFSERLDEAMKAARQGVEFYTYEGDDHNLSRNLSLALDRSVEFFDKYLK